MANIGTEQMPVPKATGVAQGVVRTEMAKAKQWWPVICSCWEKSPFWFISGGRVRLPVEGWTAKKSVGAQHCSDALFFVPFTKSTATVLGQIRSASKAVPGKKSPSVWAGRLRSIMHLAESDALAGSRNSRPAGSRQKDPTGTSRPQQRILQRLISSTGWQADGFDPHKREYRSSLF